MESGMTVRDEDAMVAEAADKFPRIFGLRGFPGKTFCIVKRQSFVSGNAIQLYVFLVDEDDGERVLHRRAFGKETPARLRREVITAPE